MKKTLKKAMAVVVSLAMLLSLVFTVSANEFSDPLAERLRFNDDGSFRILQIADTQDDLAPAPGMIEFIKTALATYKPDLVVFTGDNTCTVDTKIDAEYAIRAIIDPVAEAGVPFTFVFGNHDAENVAKEFHYSIYTQYDNCLAYDADPELYGMGTHNLPIYSSDGKKVVYNLWMFDSNMYDDVNGGYDHIHEDQLQWYVDASNELKAQNGGEPVPSLCFQHIVPNEALDYILESDTQVENGYYNDDNGKWYYLDPNYCEAGSILQEYPCPGAVDSQQMELFAQQGDVNAVFVGHDHVNDYVINTTLTNAKGDSIDIVNTPGASFQSYGNENVRGCRIIDLDEDDLWNYETSTPTFFDVMGDTEEMHILAFASENIVWWYVAKVLELIPYIGETLCNGLLKIAYNLFG